ncbi:hypothetical protein QR680_017952 [Steinernema hermaphroditum]|uniref:Uncharacterized protein n=1 Tax=Steinernema hermaphroditum TaxID=289476 RepID=A0AA39HIH5_9BILA|nr:hypothetical protein QR680_017952 [Steinernema hermaphroditum]
MKRRPKQYGYVGASKGFAGYADGKDDEKNVSMSSINGEKEECDKENTVMVDEKTLCALSGFGMSTKKAVLEGHDGKQLATDQANNNRLSKRPKRAEGRGVIAKTSSATAEINNPAPLS